MNSVDTTCLSILAQASQENTSVQVNPDSLGAMVEVGHGDSTLKVSLELLNAAYVGMVRVWPLLKEAKTTVEQAARKAKLSAAAQARQDKINERARGVQERARLRDERRRQAELDRERAREAREQARAEEKQARAEAQAKAQAQAASLAEAQAKAKVEADTRKATEAAKRVFRGPGEVAVRLVRESVKVPTVAVKSPVRKVKKGDRK